jgi:hypothetical protein
MLKQAVRTSLAAYGAVSVLDRALHDWGATTAERTSVLPGDDLVPDVGAQSTMAITINAPADAVWPWLVQMGCGRAGWYSYDFIDNGGVASATRLLAEHQDIAVGYVIPADPKNRLGFPVLMVEPERVLVLGKVVDSSDRRPVEFPGIRGRMVWSFILREPVDGVTRLLVRTRTDPQRPLERFLDPLFGLAHALMQRKQLRSIKRRVESRIARTLIIAPRKPVERRAAG